MQRYLYENLEKHFTVPKVISPFYGNKIKIPRKLKKKVKMFCGIYWQGLTNGQRLWYYMEKQNNDYKRYLIKMICTNSNVDSCSCSIEDEIKDKINKGLINEKLEPIKCECGSTNFNDQRYNYDKIFQKITKSIRYI